MAVVAEDHAGNLQLALALDIDLLRAVDHDVGDRLVGEQRLQRTEPEHFVEHDLDEFALLDLIELQFFFLQDLADDVGDLQRQFFAGQRDRGTDVDALDQYWLHLLAGFLDARQAATDGGRIGLRGIVGIAVTGVRIDRSRRRNVQAVDDRGDKAALVERIEVLPLIVQQRCSGPAGEIRKLGARQGREIGGLLGA